MRVIKTGYFTVFFTISLAVSSGIHAQAVEKFGVTLKRQLRAAKAELKPEQYQDYAWFGEEHGWLKLGGWAGDVFQGNFVGHPDIQPLQYDERLPSRSRSGLYPSTVVRNVRLGDSLPLPRLAAPPDWDALATDGFVPGMSRGGSFFVWPYDAGLTHQAEFSLSRPLFPFSGYLPLPDLARGPLRRFAVAAAYDDEFLTLAIDNEVLSEGRLALLRFGDDWASLVVDADAVWWQTLDVIDANPKNKWSKDAIFTPTGQPVKLDSRIVKSANRYLARVPLELMPSTATSEGLSVAPAIWQNGTGQIGRWTSANEKHIRSSSIMDHEEQKSVAFRPAPFWLAGRVADGRLLVEGGLAAGTDALTLEVNGKGVEHKAELEAQGFQLDVTQPGPLGPEQTLACKVGGADYRITLFAYQPWTKAIRDYGKMIENYESAGIVSQADKDQLIKFEEQARGLTAKAADSPVARILLREILAAKRALFMCHPDLERATRLLFAQRDGYNQSHNYTDMREAPSHCIKGGGIAVLNTPWRDGALRPEEASLAMIHETDGLVRDPVASFDAKTVYFAEHDGRSYQLFAMDADGSNLRQLTTELFDHSFPLPLPDGGLAFISTRCKSRFFCFYTPSSTLFRMDRDESDIRCINFNNLTDWSPSVMRDGRIMWTRSEYQDKSEMWGHTVWAMRPDGSGQELIFGNNTRGAYMHPFEIPESDEISTVIASHEGPINGSLAIVDYTKGRFDIANIRLLTPDVQLYDVGRAHSVTECVGEARPLSRDMFVGSFAPFEHFSLYLFDRWGNRELLYFDPRQPGRSPSPLRSRTPPPSIASALNPALAQEEKGVFFLADAYAGLDGKVEPGLVAYLQIVEEVKAELRFDPNTGLAQARTAGELNLSGVPAHGPDNRYGDRRGYTAKTSHGIVPVNTDGSAVFTAPAGKMLYFQLLDKDRLEIQRMTSVVQLVPGEMRGCIGCHEDRGITSTPSMAPASRFQTPVEPTLPAWGKEPFDFVRHLQPVFDASCVRCHSGGEKGGGLDLRAGYDEKGFPKSYKNLLAKGLVHYINASANQPHRRPIPMDFGARHSKLVQVLRKGHHEVKLNDDEWQRITFWIDANVPPGGEYIQYETRKKALGNK